MLHVGFVSAVVLRMSGPGTQAKGAAPVLAFPPEKKILVT